MRRPRSMVRETGARPVVVDASMAVKWFAAESDSAVADQLIAGDRILVAPDIMPVEAANAWWKKVRRGEMGKADLDQAVASLLAMGLEWIPAPSLVDRAASMAADTGHTVYDCTYLVACAERGASIATADERMRGAAERMRLNVWRPEEE
jgi:predicted nucleic acid-binding protein